MQGTGPRLIRSDVTGETVATNRLRVLSGMIAFIAITAVFFLAGLSRTESLSEEGCVREMICTELVAGSVAGRQALFASVWFPPLPTLLRLPIVSLLGPSGTSGVPSILLSAFFGAAVLVLLNRALLGFNSSWYRLVAVAALALNPVFFRLCTDGSSATASAFFALLAAFELAMWIEERKLRRLALFALASAIASITAPAMTAWLVLMTAVLVVHEACRRGRKKYEMRATLVTGLLPLVYILGLWMLANWLIMGDFIFFLRSLPSAWRQTHPAVSGLDDLLLCLAVPTTVGIALLLIGRKMGERKWTGMAILILSAVVASTFFISHGSPGATASSLVASFALATMAMGRFQLACGRWDRRAVAVCIVALTVAGSFGLLPAAEAEPEATGPGLETISQIAEQIASESRHARVFVCGYESFGLLGHLRDPEFVRSINFDFVDVGALYRGMATYVLVKKPEGRSAVDTVHWKYTDLYGWGCEGAVFAADYDDWRLFELVTPR